MSNAARRIVVADGPAAAQWESDPLVQPKIQMTHFLNPLLLPIALGALFAVLLMLVLWERIEHSRRKPRKSAADRRAARIREGIGIALLLWTGVSGAIALSHYATHPDSTETAHAAWPSPASAGSPAGSFKRALTLLAGG